MAHRTAPKGKAPSVGQKTQYRALVGLSFGDRQVSEGDVVEDIPEESLEWLLAGGYVKKEGK